MLVYKRAMKWQNGGFRDVFEEGVKWVLVDGCVECGNDRSMSAMY